MKTRGKGYLIITVMTSDIRNLGQHGLSGGFRGGSGGSFETPFATKLFQFHGVIYENKSAKMLKTNLVNFNPHSKNPGS